MPVSFPIGGRFPNPADMSFIESAGESCSGFLNRRYCETDWETPSAIDPGAQIDRAEP
jgi:hypothetical protein